MQPTNGAISWFFLPGTSFQPSEFMKIVLIIITAGIIDEHNKEKVIDSFEMDVKLFIEVAKWALPPMVLILLPVSYTHLDVYKRQVPYVVMVSLLVKP